MAQGSSWRAAAACGFLFALLCSAHAAQLVLQIGENVPSGVAGRTRTLLQGAWADEFVEVGPSENVTNVPSGSLVISLGFTTTRDLLVTDFDLSTLTYESFIVRANASAFPGSTLVVGDGNLQKTPSYRFGSVGAGYATYAILEELGFSFLHPLEPTSPDTIVIPADGLELKEEPYWGYRNWHCTPLIDMCPAFLTLACFSAHDAPA